MFFKSLVYSGFCKWSLLMAEQFHGITQLYQLPVTFNITLTAEFCIIKIYQ